MYDDINNQPCIEVYMSTSQKNKSINTQLASFSFSLR